MIYNLDATGEQRQIVVWLGERTVFQIESDEPIKFWSDIEGDVDDYIAGFYPDSSDIVTIDVTDYLRAKRECEHILLANVDDSIQWNVEVDLKAGINPESVYIPYYPWRNISRTIVPPSRNITQYFTAEFRADPTKTWYFLALRTGTANWLSPSFYNGSANILSFWTWNDASFERYIDIYNTEAPSMKNRLYFVDTKCGVDRAMVSWRSFTGVMRRHIFEVKNWKNAATDSYSLIIPDNQYKVINGREVSLVLRLDSLNSYDLWYYSDVIQSSEVYVDPFSRIGGDTSAYDYKQHRVQIVTKNITYPDGEANNGVLEIEVKFMRYDAVAL